MADASPDNSADLSLVSSDDLVKELSSRYDHLLLVRERFPTDHEGECLYDYKGGISGAIGLAEREKRMLLSKAMPEPIDGEDDHGG